MYSLNRAQLIGVLTEDPAIRQTPSGQSVGDLNIETKHSFEKEGGEIQEGTAYHNVVVWRGLADICGQYLKKGSSVYIEGRLQTESWEDESGTKKYKTKIIAEDMIMLDSKDFLLESSNKTPQGLNKAEIIGNLTRDPELRQTISGFSVANMGVATNYAWRNQLGENQERTEFHNLVAWKDLADKISNLAKKGDKIYASGRLQTRSWEGKDGVKRYTTEIIADRIIKIGRKTENKEDEEIEKKSETIKEVKVPKEKFTEPASEAVAPEISYDKEIKPEDLPF